MSLLEGKTKAELDFIKESARTYLVSWADKQMRIGQMPQEMGNAQVFLEFAQSKGWVSKKEPLKVLATGFNTAAAFLRR